MQRALSRAGAEELVTPREIIRDYLTLLNILRDNKGASFDSLLSMSTGSEATDTDGDEHKGKLLGEKRKIGLFDIDI